MTGWIGRTLSKVKIDKQIGRGGMAEVYLGLHTTLNRPVAVKILQEHYSEDAQLMSRFHAEAQSVAALRHPNIVQVFDFDIIDGRPYIIMELVDGMSLADYLTALYRMGHILPLDTVNRLTVAIASALDYAHARDIVHRDIKPANVMLRKGSAPFALGVPLPVDVEPVLTDFGVARIASQTTRTATGTILGTPAYMSPEQVLGEPVDARSDIYSLGIMVYELLGGRPPFVADTDTPASVLYKHVNVAPPPLPNTSPEVQRVVTKALAKDRTTRYQKAGEFARELQAALGIAGSAVPVASAQAATRVAAPPPGASKTQAGKPRRTGVMVGGIAAVVLAVGCMAAVGWAALGGWFGPTVTATSAPVGIVDGSTTPGEAATIAPLVEIPPASGLLVFRDAALTGTIAGLIAPPAGFVYEAWLTGPDLEPLSLGRLNPADSQVSLQQIDPSGRNLLGQFLGYVITLEPEPDVSPAMSDHVAYVAEVQSEIHAWVQLVEAESRGAPLGQAVTFGLQGQAVPYNSHLDLAVGSINAGDLGGGHTHAEHVINIVEGASGDQFADWNGNGRFENPGDPVGLVPYLSVYRELLLGAARSPDVTPENQALAQRLATEISNLLVTADEALDLCLRLASADQAAEAAPLATQLSAHRMQNSVESLLSQAAGLPLSITLDVSTLPR
ncbi:MAG: protein kinase [Anaerolineales bacterium]